MPLDLAVILAWHRDRANDPSHAYLLGTLINFAIRLPQPRQIGA
jgi:hypothetical protein